MFFLLNVLVLAQIKTHSLSFIVSQLCSETLTFLTLTFTVIASFYCTSKLSRLSSGLRLFRTAMSLSVLLSLRKVYFANSSVDIRFHGRGVKTRSSAHNYETQGSLSSKDILILYSINVIFSIGRFINCILHANALFNHTLYKSMLLFILMSLGLSLRGEERPPMEDGVKEAGPQKGNRNSIRLFYYNL